MLISLIWQKKVIENCDNSKNTKHLIPLFVFAKGRSFTNLISSKLISEPVSSDKCYLLMFFKINFFSKNYFRFTISVKHFLSWYQIVCKYYQQILSADDTSRQRVNNIVVLLFPAFRRETWGHCIWLSAPPPPPSSSRYLMYVTIPTVLLRFINSTDVLFMV